MKSTLALLLLGFFASGCVVMPFPMAGKHETRGRPLTSADTRFIVPGVTTRAEIEQVLGGDYRECFTAPSVAYSWEKPGMGVGYFMLSTGRSTGGHVEGSKWRALFIAFDDQGVVVRQSFRRLDGGKSLDHQLERWARRYAARKPSSPAAKDLILPSAAR